MLLLAYVPFLFSNISNSYQADGTFSYRLTTSFSDTNSVATERLSRIRGLSGTCPHRKNTFPINNTIIVNKEFEKNLSVNGRMIRNAAIIGLLLLLMALAAVTFLK